MMKKTLLLSLSIATILMTSCSKNDKKDAAPSMKRDYAPYSVGSSFTYDYITRNYFSEAYDTTTATMKITGTENYKGDTWLTGNNAPIGTSGGQNALIKVDDNAYTALLKSFDGGNGQVIKDFKLDFLKFPLSVGKTWESQHFTNNAGGVVYESYYKFKVVSTTANLSVNGKLYSNLVKIQEDYYLGTAADGATLFETTYRYYDKTAGLVNSTILTMDFFTDEITDTLLIQNLVSYEIK